MLAHPGPENIDMHPQLSSRLRHRDPRSRNSRIASILNSLLCRRRPAISHIRFRKNTLKLVSTEPGAAHHLNSDASLKTEPDTASRKQKRCVTKLQKKHD